MVTTRRLSSPDPTKPPSGYARPQVGCFPTASLRNGSADEFLFRPAHDARRCRRGGERLVCCRASDPAGHDHQREIFRKTLPPAANRPSAAPASGPKAAETLESFTPRYEISLRGVKPEPEGLSTGWLWITPAARRAAPVCERIIESPARRTPDPVSRDAGPRTASPPASRTARPPTRRNRSAVPLARGAGCSTPVTIPTVGHWMVARTQRPGLDPDRSG